MFFYVYILKTNFRDEYYIGCTNDLQKRLKEHNLGKVRSTAHKTPCELIHYEAFKNSDDAYNREKYLKSGWGRSFIKKNLKNYLEE